ncbi:unnamed protein product [Lota lota]
MLLSNIFLLLPSPPLPSPSLSPPRSISSFFFIYPFYLFNFLSLILQSFMSSLSTPLSLCIFLPLFFPPSPLSLCNYIYDFKMLVSTFLCIYVFSKSPKDVS